ncbi:MAG: hypothetical protein EOP32_02555 [Rhodococcus sp. (in: high G+C Gram-positive bacteria)]|nr:MAG: hypothetical protein EOP32_02555 [Rhodococcus sp. (in: high G+C Gram-positive bacteria)]
MHVAVGGRQVSRLVGQIQVSDLGVLTPYIVTERGDDGVAKIAELTEDLGARTRSSKPSAPRNR